MHDHLYRYLNYSTSEGERLTLWELEVVSYTKCGAWIDFGAGTKKFINLNAKKQYACRTKEEAYTSYLARKSRQIHILRGQLEKAILASKLTVDNEFIATPLRLFE